MPSSGSPARQLTPSADSVMTVLFSVSRPKLQGNAGVSVRGVSAGRGVYTLCMQLQSTGLGTKVRSIAAARQLQAGEECKPGGLSPKADAAALAPCSRSPPAGREEAAAAVRGQQAHVDDAQHVQLHPGGGQVRRGASQSKESRIRDKVARVSGSRTGVPGTSASAETAMRQLTAQYSPATTSAAGPAHPARPACRVRRSSSWRPRPRPCSSGSTATSCTARRRVRQRGHRLASRERTRKHAGAWLD